MATTKTTATKARRAADTNPGAAAIQAIAALAPIAAQQAPAAPVAPTVALRGGPAVQAVRVRAGAKYSTKAEHNQKWWAHLQTTCKDKGAPVVELTKEVPAHFIGYCLRRGYLEQA